MSECGCTMGNKTFKLKAPDGWYVFQMDHGCNCCCVGPSIRISMAETSKFYYEDELEHIPDLPTIGQDKEEMAIINCGISPDQAISAAIKCFTGAETEDNHVDEILAETFGEDLWEEALNNSPSVILPK